LLAREDALFQKRTRKSKETFDKAQEMLLNGVPMPWMGDWGTSHPIFVSKASGNRVTDIDGNEYVDFCLGDTGACLGTPRKQRPRPSRSRCGKGSPR
jgi:glutamate-1-semialdehyde 2,1-aminomutase